MVVEGGRGRRRVGCEPTTLSDGTTVYVRKVVGQELTEGDLKALEQFNTLLKCQACTQRAQCALDGCAREMMEGSENGC